MVGFADEIGERDNNYSPDSTAFPLGNNKKTRANNEIDAALEGFDVR